MPKEILHIFMMLNPPGYLLFWITIICFESLDTGFGKEHITVYKSDFLRPSFLCRRNSSFFFLSGNTLGNVYGKPFSKRQQDDSIRERLTSDGFLRTRQYGDSFNNKNGFQESWKSPAKLNLFLRVQRKNQKNYHELASLFHTIGLCDTITLKKNYRLEIDDEASIDDQSSVPLHKKYGVGKSGHRICVYGKDKSIIDTIPVDDGNLLLQAVDLFLRRVGDAKSTFSLKIEKHIPLQAGLGGGSGNAATVLFALNQFYDKFFTLNELKNMASELGSDCSFFFSTGAAYCTGVGSNVTDLYDDMSLEGRRSNLKSGKGNNSTFTTNLEERSIGELDVDLPLSTTAFEHELAYQENVLNFQTNDLLSTIHVFKPEVGLSTRTVFERLDIAKCKNGPDPLRLLEGYGYQLPGAPKLNSRCNDWQDCSEIAFNDLELPAFTILPELAELKRFLLDSGFRCVMMSGSGSALFALGKPTPGFVYRGLPCSWESMLRKKFPDTQVFRTKFIRRNSSNWYEVE